MNWKNTIGTGIRYVKSKIKTPFHFQKTIYIDDIIAWFKKKKGKK